MAAPFTVDAISKIPEGRSGEINMRSLQVLESPRRPQPNEASLARNCSTKRAETYESQLTPSAISPLPLASLGPPDTKELTMPADISFFTDPPEPIQPKGKPRKVEIQSANDELTQPLSGLPKAPNYRVITETT
jgi:hypothetical protein